MRVLPLLLALLLTASEAAAEPFLDLYGGAAFTRSADLRVSRPDAGDDYRLEDVSFDSESFRPPPYYGLRAGLFLPGLSWLGVAVEFIHFKVFADTDETRRLVGVRGGAPVDQMVPVSTAVQSFSISHGVNYLTADLLVRLAVGGRGPADPRAPLHLYGGLGAGPVIAHPENRVDGLGNRERYEYAGIGAQGFVGARLSVTSWLGVFLEGKVSGADLEVNVAGGEARLDERTLHLAGGITLRLP